MEWYFQISDHFLDLCRVRRQRSGDVCIASRWSKLLHCRGRDICWVIRVSIGWSHDNSPFVRMCKESRRRSEWNILNPTLARASMGMLIFILVVGRTLVLAAAVFP